MGIDVSTKLVVGVPITKLGEIKKTETEVDVFDAFGKPDGKATLEEWNLVCPDGKKHLLGSNKKRIEKRSYMSHVDWNLIDLPMAHVCNYHDPNSVIMGFEFNEIDHLKPDRYQYWGAYDYDIGVQEEMMIEAAKSLKNVYGYEGAVQLIVLSMIG